MHMASGHMSNYQVAAREQSLGDTLFTPDVKTPKHAMEFTLVAIQTIINWGLYVNSNAERNYIAGSLGIGVAPTTKLDVNGQARIRTIPNMTIPANGQLLTADPNGNVQGIPFPGDTTLVLRGDGSWGSVTPYTNTLTGSCVRGVTPCVDQNGNAVSCASAPSMNWGQCVSACKNSTHAGFTDWRVPSMEEWFCLYAESYPFGAVGTKSFWSLTPDGAVQTFPTGRAYFFKPGNGYYSTNPANSPFSCMCVR